MLKFRSLTAKYVFLSSILLLFFSLCFSAAFYFVRYMEGDAKKINLGGKQRMLTYDISSHMHFITSNIPSAEREHHIRGAEKAMDEYENALYSLKDGNEKIGLEPVHDAKSIAQVRVLIDLWQNTQRPVLRDIMRNPARGGEETCNACHAAISANFDKVEQLVQYLEAHHDREIRNFSLFGLTALGMLIVMTVFVFIFVRRSLIIPAKDLKSAASEVEKGNFDVSVDVQTRDEIGALGNTFNAMAQGLKDLFHEKAEHVQKLNVLNTVAMAASQTLTLEVMLDKVLEAIRSLKPFEKGAIFLCEENTRMLRLVVSHNFSPEHEAQCSLVPYGECLCGISAEQGEVLVSESSNEDARHTKTYPDLQEHGHILLPLKSRGRMLGILSLYTPAGIKPADNEIGLYKAIADIISVSIHNAMNHRQVAMLAQSLETSMDLVIITDTEGKILHINPHAKTYLGYTQEEIRGKHISHMQPTGDTEGLWEHIFHKTVAEGSWKGEIINVRKDGYRYPVLLSTALITYENNSVIAMVGVVRDITERKRAEKELMIKDWAITSAIDAIVLADLEARLTYVNPAFLRMWGYDHEKEVVGMPCTKLWQEPMLSEEIMERLKSTGEWTGERAAVRKDGSVFYVHLSASMVRDEAGQPICIMASVADISEHKRAEAEKKNLQSQLLQSQKLESVGRLAGGVAHDFNNMLSVVLGYSELILAELPEGHPMSKNITIIREAGERAASLTQQLLAFSRKQVLQLEIIQLNSVIENIIRMITRMIGEDIIIELHMKSARNILADPGQIGQIMMNLAVNARDSMPSGGRLTIETADVELDEEYAQLHEEVKAGQYVMLAVSDTGTGMSREVQERIFEPFFTTKELGKGTGLGLAMVYGIVKQHNGHISVYSEMGKGTSFKVYLPAVEEEAKAPKILQTDALVRGSETILVVDDEQSIRTLIIDTLKPLGYTLLDACCGEDAVKISDMTEGKIDLLLTDVIMPRMNGYELADILKVKRPGIAIILMSGYTDEAIAGLGMSRPWATFIQKPLTPVKLKNVLRKVLDEKTGDR